jgi:hypothetical protein
MERGEGRGRGERRYSGGPWRRRGGGLVAVLAGGRGSEGWATQRRRVSVARERARERARDSFPTSRVVDCSPGEARGKVRVNSAHRQPNGVVGSTGAIWPVDS